MRHFGDIQKWEGFQSLKAAAARNSLTARSSQTDFGSNVQQTQDKCARPAAGFYQQNEVRSARARWEVRADFFASGAESFIILLRTGSAVDRALNSLDILRQNGQPRMPGAKGF